MGRVECIGEAILYTGDVLEVLRSLPDESVHCIVTSPPYWGLRDYGIEPSVWDGAPECVHEWGDERISSAVIGATLGGPKSTLTNWSGSHEPAKEYAEKVKSTNVSQGAFCRLCGAWRGAHGLEPTPELYVQHEVAIFREARRVLRADGTAWVNLGDSYASTGRSDRKESPGVGAKQEMTAPGRTLTWKAGGGSNFSWSIPSFGIEIKPKDLVGIPWRVAFALQADGWYLRADIIWHKPNPMPESVTDRPTKAHEYIFLLSKSARYFYDAEAVRETGSAWDEKSPAGWDEENHGRAGMGRFRKSGNKVRTPGEDRIPGASHVGRGFPWEGNSRNRRSVWTVATAPYKEAHFSTFPPDLIKPCILAGCPDGGTVLDPFGGSGTTAAVALEYGRRAILIERKPEYVDLQRKRLRTVAGRPLLAFGGTNGA